MPTIDPAQAADDAALANSVVLQEVVLAYPHLFEKHQIPGSTQEPKYNTTILLPLGFDMSALTTLATEVLVKKFGSDAVKQFQAGAIKSPFRKQMEKAAQGVDGYSSDPAALCFNTSTDRLPHVVDQNVQPVLDPTKIYSGVVCHVQVNAYAWSHPTGGRGLSFGLMNVQIVRDGPRICGATPDASKVFKPIGGSKPADQTEEQIRALFGAT